MFFFSGFSRPATTAELAAGGVFEVPRGGSLPAGRHFGCSWVGPGVHWLLEKLGN